MLCSNGIAANSRKTWEALKSKHPHSPPLTIPMDHLSQSSPNILSADFDILSIIHYFPKDAVCVPSRLRIQHILDALEATLPNSVTKVLLSVANLLASGKVSAEITIHLAGESLIVIAINKSKDPNCDVRTIAMGEVMCRLTSRCLCAMVKNKAADYFSQQQLEVKLIHSLRACVDHHWNHDDFVVLKVDLCNACNNVLRQAAYSINATPISLISFPGCRGALVITQNFDIHWAACHPSQVCSKVIHFYSLS